MHKLMKLSAPPYHVQSTAEQLRGGFPYFAHHDSVSKLWTEKWRPPCSHGIYPFTDGDVADFDPIFADLVNQSGDDPAVLYRPDDYARPFIPVGEQLARQAADALTQSKPDQALNLYLRSAAVFRIARFPINRSKLGQEAWRLGKAAYDEGGKLLDPPSVPVSLPFSHANVAAGDSDRAIEAYPPSSQSQNVVISDNVIEGARSDGIAIQGVLADADDPVLISNNILNRNQWIGVFPVTAGDPALSPGGQLLLDDGTNLEVVNNIIADGLCSACYHTLTSVGSGISAVEIGDQSAPSFGIKGLYLHDNYFYNGGYVSAIYENPETTETALQLNDNMTSGFGNFTNISAQNSILYNNYSIQAMPNLSLNGGAYYTIFREATEDYNSTDPAIDSIRWASKMPGELKNIVNCKPGNSCPIYEEATFQLSSGPVVGGPPRPLFRCFTAPQVDGQYISPIAASLDDFISLDQHCNGQGLLHSIAGYSFAGPNPALNVYEIYECQIVYSGSIMSHFVSWDPACGGQRLDESLGFAMAPSQ